MDELKLKARAKINLGLDVLRRRPDGYHDLRMIMQTVDWYDEITLRIGERTECRTDSRLIPADSHNLAYRAAQLLLEEFSVRGGVKITLEKHIPVAAGLAGGSADAAAVLIGVNRIFDLGLSERELMERGVRIGADVPYCIMRGTALAEGIGERLTPLPSVPGAYVLLAKPPVQVSTKFVYENLKLSDEMSHPDIDGQIRAIQDGDLEQMAALMGNVLETVTIPAFPVIGQIREQMLRLGAVGARMSGSGPTVFGLFADRKKAEQAYESLLKGKLADDVYLTHFMHTGG